MTSVIAIFGDSTDRHQIAKAVSYLTKETAKIDEDVDNFYQTNAILVDGFASLLDAYNESKRAIAALRGKLHHLTDKDSDEVRGQLEHLKAELRQVDDAVADLKMKHSLVRAKVRTMSDNKGVDTPLTERQIEAIDAYEFQLTEILRPHSIVKRFEILEAVYRHCLFQTYHEGDEVHHVQVASFGNTFDGVTMPFEVMPLDVVQEYASA